MYITMDAKSDNVAIEREFASNGDPVCRIFTAGGMLSIRKPDVEANMGAFETLRIYLEDMRAEIEREAK
jgi:hypothetical protein